MREIAELHAALKPVETLFIVDAMQPRTRSTSRAPSTSGCRSPA